ncbi:protein SHQ1 homolog [Protopterus annectens]|uniref:protein SHQ1 homolog n=1 Tax=Protopterus annectens TaxID=7888 RepID=UPI001CFB842F|nr:protein SHQ1 homolog [Protopterus annectens]
MITPAFELSQDSNFLTITIKVPYARVCEVDLYIDGEDFKFFAKPYFLRLTLPGRIVEDGREKASYNADEGASSGNQTNEGTEEEEDDEDEEFDWQIEQVPFQVEPEHSLTLQCYYGFGNQRSGIFTRLQDELSEAIDLKNPDSTSPVERTKKRLAVEEAKFDPDHYLADFFDSGAVQELLRYKPWWDDLYKMKKDEADCHEHEKQETLISFSEGEKQQLKNFTNRSYILDKRACHLVLLSLVDIILAYAYEIRNTEGEKNVESSWNIRKLSGTLCWFENYSCLQDVLVCFGRRVLCYPLYRHFMLVTKAVQDANKIFHLGRACVLKCLLDIHKIFQECDPAYILNDLYITDYCIWIQKQKPKKLASLAASLQNAKLTKSDLGFELEELEHAAMLVQEDQHKSQQANCVSGQQFSSESETDEFEESSSCSSSGTEESDSDAEESPSHKTVTGIKEQHLKSSINPCGAADEVKPALSVATGNSVNDKNQSRVLDVNNESDITLSSCDRRKLIEVVDEQRDSEGRLLQNTESNKNSEGAPHKEELHSFETKEYFQQPEAAAPQGDFLEVSSLKKHCFVLQNLVKQRICHSWHSSQLLSRIIYHYVFFLVPYNIRALQSSALMLYESMMWSVIVHVGHFVSTVSMRKNMKTNVISYSLARYTSMHSSIRTF